MCWSGATGRCTTKGAPQNNKTSIKFTARGQKAPGGVFMVEYGGGGLLQRHKLHGYRRGVPFVRTRRRGLRSMSGHPAYAWGNPPTLRRSSFPQRASRPAGGPIPKHAWGCAPRPPNAKLRLDTNDVNIVRTAPQIRSQGACGAFYFGYCRNRIKINTL